jgi:hypothetical protein
MHPEPKLAGKKGGKIPALLIYGALIAGRDQQPSKQSPNDFGLSDFERPISPKLFVLLVPEGGRTPHDRKGRRILSPRRGQKPSTRRILPSSWISFPFHNLLMGGARQAREQPVLFSSLTIEPTPDASQSSVLRLRDRALDLGTARRVRVSRSSHLTRVFSTHSGTTLLRRAEQFPPIAERATFTTAAV